jgi:DNA-binding XRE family transcriptional regulator
MATGENAEAEDDGGERRPKAGEERPFKPGAAAQQPGSDEPLRSKDPKDTREKKTRNNVRKIRMERMMSKAELARRAAVSTLTIDRVERGLPCRMDTKRKILEALGLHPTDRVTVFGEDD